MKLQKYKLSNRSNGNSSPVHRELVWQEFAQSSVIRNSKLFILCVAWKHKIFCEKWTDQHDISLGWRILNLVMFIWIWIYHCLHLSWKASMGSVQLSIRYTKSLSSWQESNPWPLEHQVGTLTIHWATRTHGVQSHLTEFMCDRHPA